MAASTVKSWLGRSYSIYLHRKGINYFGKCFGGLYKSDGAAQHRRCSFYTDDARSSTDDMSTSSTFESMMRDRRRRSRNSVLVHVYSKYQVPRLHAYCQTYGTVQRSSHYTLGNDKDFVLIEFKEEKSVAGLLQSAYHFDDAAIIPVHSRYLWFRDEDDPRSNNSKGSHNKSQVDEATLNDSAIHYETRPTDQSLIERIQNANSVSEQMIIHHESVKLTELGQQLRFFVCHQLESAFSGLFAECVVLPYGSSVNGFGKFDGDLDMVLTFEVCKKGSKDSKLFFHTKRSLTNGRTQMQRYLEIFGDIIGSFFPGCCAVQRILHARVPIVKFQQELVNLECDLSMSNLSGVYMSELLYLYGELDERMRPLVSTVLRWAKLSGLTHENPGRWITNFNLILMVAIFLQCRPQPILPSLHELQRLSGSTDRRISDQIDCTFLRDLSKFPKLNNCEALENLLKEFFTFYLGFNFKNRGLSLIPGKDIEKRDHSPLYIQNPLQIDLNVSKNVSVDELARIHEHMRRALWALETSSKSDSGETWGLLKLFCTEIGRTKQQLTAKTFQVGHLLGDNLKTSISNRIKTSQFIFQSPSDQMQFNVDMNNGRAKILSGADLASKLGLEKLVETKATAKNSKKKKSTARRRPRMQPRPWSF